jgi:hypothetical protein
MTGVAALLTYGLPDIEAEVQEAEERARQLALGGLAVRPGDAHVAEAPDEPVFF